MLALIGEQFEGGQEICGAVVSVRHSEDILSIWNRSADNFPIINIIRDRIKTILKLPNFITVEYKRHKEAQAKVTQWKRRVLYICMCTCSYHFWMIGIHFCKSCWTLLYYFKYYTNPIILIVEKLHYQ